MSEKNHIEELFIRYFLGEITEDELRELNVRIMNSPENKVLFFQLKQISDSGRRSVWSEVEKEESWRRMYARIYKISEEQKQPDELPATHIRKLRFSRYVRYAAVFIATLGMGWGVNEFVKRKTSGDMRHVISVYNEIRVERGGRGNTLILPDGSKVMLNSATTFRYPAGFSETDRTVYLEGEAWFEIAKDETKPFIVKFKKQNITVLGTSFNVEAYSDENYSVVTLLSGSVSLETCNEKGESMSRMFLKPNQQAVSDDQSGSVSVRNVDETMAESSWVKGRYKFKDEALGNIAGRLEKYYDVQIHIEDESLRQMKFTGSFSKNQDIREILQVLDYENRYSVKRVVNEIFIVGK
jgi:ferric-dicitrate binding protein FerR (iron transport regulator)